MDRHNPYVGPTATLLFSEESPAEPQAGEIVEVPLLLSAGQMSALETAAHRHGLTAGEMVRRLLDQFIADSLKTAQPISCKREF